MHTPNFLTTSQDFHSEFVQSGIDLKNSERSNIYHQRICHLQRIERISITQALTLNLAPKTFKRFFDDSHARFTTREQSLQFLDILNSQDPSIQYTIEFENVNKQLSFLDVNIVSTCNNYYDFKIFWKTIANVQIKPNSNIAPHIAMGVFKGFFFTSIHHM